MIFKAQREWARTSMYGRCPRRERDRGQRSNGVEDREEGDLSRAEFKVSAPIRRCRTGDSSLKHPTGPDSRAVSDKIRARPGTTRAGDHRLDWTRLGCRGGRWGTVVEPDD